MSDKAASADIAKMSFEDALAELEEIVRALDDGKSNLDDAITAYERGSKLKAHCEKKLKEAQAKVEKITVGAGGDVGSEPADID